MLTLVLSILIAKFRLKTSVIFANRVVEFLISLFRSLFITWIEIICKEHYFIVRAFSDFTDIINTYCKFINVCKGFIWRNFFATVFKSQN